MNESAYMKALWKRIGSGRVGNQGQGYLDTGWLDSAFGGADARKNLMFQRIADRRDAMDRSMDLKDRALRYDRRNNTRALDIREDAIDAQSKDALMGDIITGASLPIAYIEGQNAKRAINEDRERQDRLNRRYEALLGRYK